MEYNKRTSSLPAVGGSSLLAIFAVLCLTVFALLSLSTVKASGRLSEKNLEAIVAYYDADSKAEEVLARIRSGTVPEGVELKGDIYSYECEVRGAGTIAVEARISGDVCEVLRWQQIPAAGWKPDDRLQVWTGE